MIRHESEECLALRIGRGAEQQKKDKRWAIGPIIYICEAWNEEDMYDKFLKSIPISIKL